MMEWPEPIVRVQSLSESGIRTVPDRYIKPEPERPIKEDDVVEAANIPIIDLGTADVKKVREACEEWGFFQITNHGIRPELMNRAREAWREFFHQPMELKQKYANNPKTYEGYGSRLGVDKAAKLDWSDYFFLHFRPLSLFDPTKWPSHPLHHREEMEEYMEELMKLSGRVMEILSTNLGMDENALQNAFGGDDIAACLRVNFYPKCPQPDLTLSLSAHSDPGGITVLLPDPDVSGLQVRKNGKWVTVKPAPDAFIINIGDQMQVVSNAIYKSVEHRVTANSAAERVTLAFFYNPRGDIPLEPAKEVVTSERPAMYEPMTYNQYRLYIRTRGPQGKAHIESLKSPAP
ncbi:hypothetical protein V2J09_024241 [Rumex salicifolius]